MATRYLLPLSLFLSLLCVLALRAAPPAGADWEIEPGTDRNATHSTGQFYWESGIPMWRPDNQSQPFQIEYAATTPSARLTVRDSADIAWTRTLTNSGPAPGANAIWTPLDGGFFVSKAAPNGAQARSIDPDLQILSRRLPTSFATSGLPEPHAAMSAPSALDAAGTGGNRFLAGNVRFTGLTGLGGDAQGSQLHLSLNPIGPDTPEAQTFFLVGIGLLVVGFGSRRRSRE